MEFEKRLNAGGILSNNPEFFFENRQNTLTSHFKQSPSIKLVKSNNFIQLIFTFLFQSRNNGLRLRCVDPNHHRARFQKIFQEIIPEIQDSST